MNYETSYEPLYLKLKNQLREAILQGLLKPGDKVPSERELSDQYNVARLTARRALQELEEEGLIYNERSRGRYVSEHRTPLSIRVGTVGVLLYDFAHLTHPTMATLLLGVKEEIEKVGAGLHIFALRNNVETVEQIPFETVDGLIVLPQEVNPVDINHISRYKPIVGCNMDRYLAQVPIVNIDTVYGAFMATEHLIREGHKRIVLINSPIEFRINHEVYDGVRLAMLQSQIELDLIENVYFGENPGYEAMKRLIEEDPALTGVIASEDMTAWGAIRALKEVGKRVPEDVSVISVANVPGEHNFQPSISTIYIPWNDIGRKLVRLLMRAIKEPGDRWEEIRITPKLILKESTKPISTGTGKVSEF